MDVEKETLLNQLIEHHRISQDSSHSHFTLVELPNGLWCENIGVGKLSDRVSCLRLGWLRGIAGMGVESRESIVKNEP